MPPLLPTRRPWPQTLLLTALALLIAAGGIGRYWAVGTAGGIIA